MTKADVEEIVKRYPFVIEAAKAGEKTAAFYIGNRKQIFEITEGVKAVYAILEEIEESERDRDVRCMRDGIKKGRSDVAIMQNVYWQKNAYYERKDRLIDKIFECCISKGFVRYEEIMNEMYSLWERRERKSMPI